MLQSLIYQYGGFHYTAWWNSQYYIAQIINSMELDSVGIIAILSMLYITARIVKT